MVSRPLMYFTTLLSFCIARYIKFKNVKSLTDFIVPGEDLQQQQIRSLSCQLTFALHSGLVFCIYLVAILILISVTNHNVCWPE